MTTSEALSEFLMEQQLHNNSPATIDFYRNGKFLRESGLVLRVFASWLVRRQLIDESPLDDLPRVKVPKGQSEFVVFSGTSARTTSVRNRYYPDLSKTQMLYL